LGKHRKIKNLLKSLNIMEAKLPVIEKCPVLINKIGFEKKGR
jgi:DNA-directed RNA polymerase subunit H (RpoH/RPB5)